MQIQGAEPKKTLCLVAGRKYLSLFIEAYRILFIHRQTPEYSRVGKAVPEELRRMKEKVLHTERSPG